MGFLVFRCVVLWDSLKAALVEKFLFPSFCWEHAFSPIFTVCTILSANPFNWGWHGGVLYGLHPIFSNHRLRSSSQNIRVFGMPFLENMTLRIIYRRTFLIWHTDYFRPAWKKSTSINKSPIPVMYVWSICTDPLLWAMNLK